MQDFENIKGPESQTEKTSEEKWAKWDKILEDVDKKKAITPAFEGALINENDLVNLTKLKRAYHDLWYYPINLIKKFEEQGEVHAKNVKEIKRLEKYIDDKIDELTKEGEGGQIAA